MSISGVRALKTSSRCEKTIEGEPPGLSLILPRQHLLRESLIKNSDCQSISGPLPIIYYSRNYSHYESQNRLRFDFAKVVCLFETTKKRDEKCRFSNDI